MGDFEPSAKVKKRSRRKRVSPKTGSVKLEDIKLETAESFEDEEEAT